jgi:hypothetical protein
MTFPTVIPVKTAAASANTHGPAAAVPVRQTLAELIEHNKQGLTTLAAAGTAVAVGVSVRSRARIARWAGAHPRAAVAAGALIGGAAGAAAARLSVATMVPVADKVTAAVTRSATSAAQVVARHATPLVVAGGTLAGGAAGAVAGRYLAHRPAGQGPTGEAAPGDGADVEAAPEAVPDSWLGRLQKWATGETRTSPQPASEAQSRLCSPSQAPFPDRSLPSSLLPRTSY